MKQKDAAYGSDADMGASASPQTFIQKDEPREDFTQTLVGVQTKTASDAFDLMCTVISMITEDMPVSTVLNLHKLKK